MDTVLDVLEKAINNLNDIKSKILLGDWISVNERLPDDDISVLGYNGNHQRICYYAGTSFYENSFKYKKWCDATKNEVLEWPITHWMPLPESPYDVL